MSPSLFGIGVYRLTQVLSCILNGDKSVFDACFVTLLDFLCCAHLSVLSQALMQSAMKYNEAISPLMPKLAEDLQPLKVRITLSAAVTTTTTTAIANDRQPL